MSGYDGSIKIKTEISTKQAEVQLSALQNRIVKTADKIDSLRSKMGSLKDTKIPTQEYSEISAQIEKAEQKFNKLLEKQEQMQREGKDNGAAWDRLTYQIEEVGNEIRYAKGELQDLVTIGKAFTLGSNTEEYAKLGQQLQYAENELSTLTQRHEVLELKQEKAAEGYKKLGNTAKKSFEKINKSVKKSGGFMKTFTSRLKGIALSLLIFNWITKAFNAVVKSIKEGFENLYNGNEKFKSSVDSIKASAATLKNALAGAFSPLVEVAIPYIQRFIEWLTRAVNLIGQFIAALTGRKTYTKAIKQSAAASKQAAEATEDETNAMNKQLSPLDKLNNLTSQENKEKSDSGGVDSGVGTMFEEVPIDNKILDFLQKLKNFLKPAIGYAQKLKDIFAKGFWDGLGDWEYRWESIKDSLTSIKNSLIDIFTDPNVVNAADEWAQSFVYMLGSLAGSVASIGLTIAANLIGGIAKYLEQNKERIKKYLISMFDIWADINYLFADFFQAVAYIFEAFASEGAQQLTANIIGIFSSIFMGITELVSKFFRDIANILIQPFVDNKEAFRTALEGFLGVLAEVTGTIKQGIDDTFDHLNQVYDEHLKPFFDSVAQGLSDLTAQFLEFWNINVKPMLDEWAEKFDTVWKEHIQPALNNIGDSLGSVFDSLKELWEDVLQPFVSWVIDTILPVLLPIFDQCFDTLMTLLSGTIENIADLMSVFADLVNLVVKLLKGDWKGAWDSAKNIVDTFTEGILRNLNTIWEKITDWYGSITELFNSLSGKVRGVSSGYTVPVPQKSRSLMAVSHSDLPDFPAYATGQVIPRTMKQHLAILGDNKQETEVVSPLSTMKQAFVEAMTEVGMVNANGGGNGVYEFSVDGQVFFRIMEKYAAEYKKQHGGKPAFT